MTLPSIVQGSTIADTDIWLIAESIPHIVWMASADGAIEYFNHQGERYVARPGRSTYGWNWITLVHPDDVDDAVRSWEQATRSHTPYRREFRLRRFDGAYRWHEFRGNPIVGTDSVVRKWIGTATDVEDARRVETDLRLAERRTAEALMLLETLHSNAPIGFGFVDRELRVLRINDTLAAMHDSTSEAQLGRLAVEAMPELWAHLEGRQNRLLEEGEAVLNVEIDGPLSAKSGSHRHWLASFYPVSLENEVIGVGVVAVDITERAKAEDARRQLSAIVEGSGDAIFGATPDGIVTSWNAAAEDLFGYTADEMIGRPWAVLAPNGGMVEQEQIQARLSAGGPSERRDTMRLHKDGSLIDVLITDSPTMDETGNVVGLSVIAHNATGRRATQHALEQSQRRMAEAQRIAHLGSFELNVASKTMAWSEELYRILGLGSDLKPTNELFVAMVHPDDRPALLAAWDDAMQLGVSSELLYRVIRGDGEERCIHSRVVPELDEDGTIVKLAGTLRDNTERVEADRVWRAAETHFKIGFDQAGVGAAILDLEGVPIRVNPAVCVLLGRREDLLVGKRWTDYTHPDEVPLWQALLARVAAGHDTYSDERRFVRPDGSIVWASSNVTLVRNEAGEPQYFLTQLQDVTERKVMEEELAYQALHDALTALPNRALLTDRLVHGLAGSRRRGSQLGVLFLDLDHFKMVNDSLGHTFGDDLLRETADRIAGAIRPGDTVARFGGDEFVVVCDDVLVLETEEIGERVLDALSKPFQIGEQAVNITASLGIAVADKDATPESLLRDSDTAMYRAKERGRGRAELFDEALRSKTELRLATASALRRALERGEFAIEYQPIIDLATGTMVSAEALLRWQHPDRGLISPDEFIPLAEETGLIVPIGAWVLEQACAQLAGWQRAAPAMSIAVNVSVRQMTSPGLATRIKQILDRCGARPESLCLELTESVFMEDVVYFGKTLASLKAIGVELSIDDFGTGYSSLSYLKRFPVDAVKVDRAFVDGLGTDPHDSALVAAIVAMADALDLEVTAEGVETQEQLSSLKQLGCRRVQGFFLGRPMAGAEIDQLVEDSYRWNVA